MTETLADAATAIALGQRDRQEDAVIADFARGAELGLAVLSDGMGGHDDGNLASRAIVAELFGALSLQSAWLDDLRADAPARLRHALLGANQRLRDHIDAGLGHQGMGGTAIATLIMDGTLRWISVGDSPLYLYRDGQLRRLNADHSIGAQIDLMVREGAMDAETGRCHPQRNCLTSALTGNAISLIDCPAEALRLHAGDIVVLASDGLQILEDRQIAQILSRTARGSSDRIAQALISGVTRKASPDQDNVSLVVIKPVIAANRAKTGHPDRLGQAMVQAAERLRHALAPRRPPAQTRMSR